MIARRRCILAQLVDEVLHERIVQGLPDGVIGGARDLEKVLAAHLPVDGESGGVERGVDDTSADERVLVCLSLHFIDRRASHRASLVRIGNWSGSIAYESIERSSSSLPLCQQ